MIFLFHYFVPFVLLCEAIVAELRTLEQKATKITKELDGILQQLNQS